MCGGSPRNDQVSDFDAMARGQLIHKSGRAAKFLFRGRHRVLYVGPNKKDGYGPHTHVVDMRGSYIKNLGLSNNAIRIIKDFYYF